MHLWHLACSGASITADDSAAWGSDRAALGGLLDPFYGSPVGGVRGPALTPQVTRLQQLINSSGLTVDRLLLTIGANDVRWANVAVQCMPLGAQLPTLLFPIPYAQQDACLDQYKPLVAAAISHLPSHFAKLPHRDGRRPQPERNAHPGREGIRH